MTPPDIAKLRAALEPFAREAAELFPGAHDSNLLSGTRFTIGDFRRAREALALLPPSDDRPCTCHPDDNPPVPCPRKYALSECRAAAALPPSAEVESRDEPSYAAGFANCWAAFDEHLNRELAARVPHIVDVVMRIVSTRSTPHHISSTPPASQLAEAEKE